MKIKKKNIKELVDLDLSVIDGHRTILGNTEIETGPLDKEPDNDSIYIKGLQTTTDKARRYKQNIPWFAIYNYGRTSGGDKINEVILDRNENIDDIIPKDFNFTFNKLKKLLKATKLNDEQIKDLIKLLNNKQNG